MYELLNKYGLTYTGASEQTDLSALRIRLEQVYYLDACFEDLYRRADLIKPRRLSVYRKSLSTLRNSIAAVDRLAENVEHPAENIVSYRYSDGIACSLDLHAAAHTFGAGEHDASYLAAADMLSYLHDTLLAVYHDGKSVIDLRQLPFFKFYIYYRSGDLYDTSGHFTVSFRSFLSVISV